MLPLVEKNWWLIRPGLFLMLDNDVTIPVQINGKKRGDLTITRDADQTMIEKAVLSLDFVAVQLDGKVPRKIIVVPQRIVNVVI
jgi:leucyl-tRNA synthetase